MGSRMHPNCLEEQFAIMMEVACEFRNRSLHLAAGGGSILRG
jgi:hypothetical protein